MERDCLAHAHYQCEKSLLSILTLHITFYRMVSIPTLRKTYALLLSFYPGSIMGFTQRMIANMATKMAAPHRFALQHVTEFVINLLLSNSIY